MPMVYYIILKGQETVNIDLRQSGASEVTAFLQNLADGNGALCFGNDWTLAVGEM
jgi:hypothetical protein